MPQPLDLPVQDSTARLVQLFEEHCSMSQTWSLPECTERFWASSSLTILVSSNVGVHHVADLPKLVLQVLPGCLEAQIRDEAALPARFRYMELRDTLQRSWVRLGEQGLCRLQYNSALKWSRLLSYACGHCTASQAYWISEGSCLSGQDIVSSSIPGICSMYCPLQGPTYQTEAERKML